MIESLIGTITAFISAIGYLGVFVLMFLESTMIPLPSELVMPFAGFLVAMGEMSLWPVIIASVLGSLAGSLFGYWLGRKYGHGFIRVFGKYLLLEKNHLIKAEKYFKRHGNKTIFIARFIPGIRHFISIPAGAGKMNLKKFSILTVLGAGIWNSFLLWTGYVLQKNWKIVYGYTQIIDMFLIVIIFLLITYYVYKIIQSKKSRALPNSKRKK